MRLDSSRCPGVLHKKAVGDPLALDLAHRLTRATGSDVTATCHCTDDDMGKVLFTP